MIAFALAFLTFFRSLGRGLKDPEFRGLFIFVIIVLGIGTVFYHFSEHWKWVDSFYFSVITLTTVGYGDFHPTTDLSKIFTVMYIFTGIGVILTFITAVGTQRRKE